MAVRDLSFRVEKGKIWGLLGPNAAGKTTTIRILTGYLPATDGKASVAGFDVFEQPNSVKKIIGYLPENVPLYPEMTVQSFLGFVSEIKQIPAEHRAEAVKNAIKTSGLASVKGRLIKNISRGFKQRVGIAQTLIHNPQVLILDEPTSGLDPAQIIEIRQLIKSFKGERTIMISTHILAEVTQVCDGAVIINEGKLMASGSLDELTASFKKREGVNLRLKNESPEAASLLKSIPGVASVASGDNGFTIEWAKDKDLRDEIIKIVAAHNLGIIEMRPLTMSIEDLYLKIISGGTEQ